MANIEFKLRYIDNDEMTTIIKELDITYYVQEYSLDKLQLVDSDTLMFAGRNCSLTIAKIKSDIDNLLMPLDDLIEKTNINYGATEPEYDLSADGESITDRMVMFIQPFIYEDTDNSNYLDRRKIFPASYNPGQNIDDDEDDDYIAPNISFVPIRDWNEEPYNAYQNEYVRDKPAYYNLILDIIKDGEKIYCGVCLIDSYSFNHKSNTLTLSFTDINGILISCFDKIGSAQTFYQNVYNSGLMIQDLYDIASKTVYAMYPMLRDIFNITDDSPISGSLKIGLEYTAGAYIHGHEFNPFPGATTMRIKMEDLSSSSLTFPDYVHAVEPRDHKYILRHSGGSGQDEKFYQSAFGMFLRQEEGGNFKATFLRFYEFQYEAVLRKTVIDIIVDLNTFERTFTATDTEERMWSNEIYVAMQDEITHPNTILRITDLNWYEWGHIKGSEEYLSRESIYEDCEAFIMADASADISDFFNLMNNEGFNTGVSTAEAFKAYMFARIRGIYTEGGTMFWKRFAFDNSPMLLVDGYYVESITEKREYYEKPNRDIAEKITDWDRKNLKHKIDQLIGYLDERIYTKYTIKIARIHLASISVGSVIRIHNIGEVSTNEYGYIDILVVSIGYNKDDMEIEGYGL